MKSLNYIIILIIQISLTVISSAKIQSESKDTQVILPSMASSASVGVLFKNK
jgi:hypothetical protein